MPYTGTPRTWVAGEVPTATHFNDNLRDFARGFTDAWTSYTPTLTASTTNPTNWTQTGYYCQVGKLVHVKGKLLAGASMTAGSGTYRVALPATANTSISDIVLGGTLYAWDNSAGVGYTIGVCYLGSSTYFQMFHANNYGANIYTNTVPWTWAANDFIQFAFTYEAA
jgi:hypothetical protein